ncbi:hypothetical protein ACIBKY_18275 [Nonomuraea sp. NPDC050394]|uniref:hypothetical protein n=1 Tax=Nonomuraea sp. NPDC050394 TaxID=3364363 RepID=UPI00379182A5
MTIVQPATTPPPAQTQSAVPAPVVTQHAVSRHSVPGRVRTLTGAVLIALALLSALLAFGSGSAREGLRVIGHDSGPQVVATAGLYLGLSDMDAQVADVLLMGSEYGERRAAALAQYERRRTEANQALLDAFELADGDPAERLTIQSVLDGLGRYERLAGEALLLNTQSDHRAGVPPEAVLDVYRKATDLMRLELLPKAYNLTLESGTIVRRTHDEESAAVRLLMLGLIAALIAVGGLIVALQLYLARAFRRRLAPALLVATALTVVAGLVGVGVLGQALQSIAAAKRDGFDAVLTTARARAIGNSLHADQARYLLDPDRADTYEHAFLDKSQSLVYADGGNVEAYHATLAKNGKVSLGLLAPVRANISDNFAAYRRFQEADGRMRTLATSGQTAQAVSAKLDELAKGFAAFDKELVTVGERYEATFTKTVAAGDGALDGLWRLAPWALGAAAVLIAAGVWPRLREYR